jgi:DNA adenine methylase
MVPYLVKCFPRFTGRYFEPFLGSGCLFLALRPKHSVLGDINRHLIQAYNYLRLHPVKLFRAVHAMPATASCYYELRSLDPEQLDPLSRAARFVYLNRYCFNGIYRTNRRGQFNVPRGTDTGGVPTLSEFLAYSKALKNAELQAADFEKCLESVNEHDFVYMDPPYAKYSRSDSGEYGYDSFREDDISRLIDALLRIDSIGGTVVLSYAATDLFSSLSERGWDVQTLMVRRNVGGFQSGRKHAEEVLISNRRLPLVEGITA